jgi:hypothetical protein
MRYNRGLEPVAVDVTPLQEDRSRTASPLIEPGNVAHNAMDGTAVIFQGGGGPDRGAAALLNPARIIPKPKDAPPAGARTAPTEQPIQNR